MPSRTRFAADNDNHDHGWAIRLPYAIADWAVSTFSSAVAGGAVWMGCSALTCAVILRDALPLLAEVLS